MIRYLAGALLVPMLAGAAILPETVGPYKRATVAQALLTDRPIWQEYGLKDAETAVFENGKAKFTATAYRLQDSTGAMAAFQWQRPPKSTPAKGGAQAAETPDSLLAQRGNYVLSFAGYKPAGPELDAVFGTLLNVDPTTLPALPTFLPARNLLANSERYILGPAGLERFVPGIPPSTAAFHTGVEAQAAAFGGPKGAMILTLFNYPTPQLAMQKAGDFQKLPGAVVKRSGPLVAVILSPNDPDLAEHVLAEVRYQAEITRNEYVPTRRDNVGYLLTDIFVFTGLLLGFCFVAGIFMGGGRVLLRYIRKGEEPPAMITLSIDRHS